MDHYVNQRNEQYITLIQDCICVISKHQVGCIDQICNIPGLRQLKILEQKSPSMKSGILRHSLNSKTLKYY